MAVYVSITRKLKRLWGPSVVLVLTPPHPIWATVDDFFNHTSKCSYLHVVSCDIYLFMRTLESNEIPQNIKK